jgi:tetratricopeptide (TPR) repeat protein
LFLFGQLLTLLLAPLGAHAQKQFLTPAQKQQFCHLFSEPRPFFNSLAGQTNGPSAQFLTLNARFLSLMTTESEELATAFHVQADELTEDLSNSDFDLQPWSYFIASQTTLYQALVYWHFGNSWKAFFKFRDAFSYFKQQKEHYPGYAANKKMEAIFEILFGSIPGDYKTVTGWMGFQGNRNKGWQMLLGYGKEVEDQPGWREEWLLWTGFISLKLDLPLPDNTTLHDSLIRQSPTLAFLYGWKALKQHCPKRSLWITDNATIDFPLLYYVRGMALLTTLETSQALECFEIFRKNYHGPSYKADALRHCAWIKLLENKPTEAGILRNEVIQQPAPSGMDKEAVRACSQDPLPNKTLLSARLLFDGGNYTTALTHLEHLNINSLTTEEKIEFHYRKGRLYMANDQPKEALPELEEAYFLGHETGRGYHATYAALELAFYYSGLTNPALEKQWIDNCLKSNKGPYKQHVREQISTLLNH